ncbi:hypothetical protein D4764_10G0007500 [Takifugu flavidus]|uniref:Uncharacterized protein n=1 Tax=Takifugu flavidus TaxID=433684 RepID=A0A5C6PN51_9TELE|nr:hypothetical protein D4764_10G0007500 [Takifugu flavidus]
MVLSETSQEVEAIIDYITGNELSFQAALAELRAFFIKSFANALIHKKVAEMKTKFPTTSSVKRKKSLQLLGNNVESLIKCLEAEKEGQGLRLVSRAERSGFTEALVGVIYSHVIEDSEHQVKAEGPDPHDPQCSDVHVAVRENVKNILVLLGWWSDTQVGNCCNRVLLNLNHTNSQEREMDTHEYSDVYTDELEDSTIQSDYFGDADVESNDLEDLDLMSDHPEDADMESNDEDSASDSSFYDDVVIKFDNLNEEEIETFDFTHSSQSETSTDSDVQLDNDEEMDEEMLNYLYNASTAQAGAPAYANKQADNHEDADTDSNNLEDADEDSNYLDEADAESNDLEDASAESNDLENAKADSNDIEDQDIDSNCFDNAALLLDYFDDKNMMLAERKKHKTFIYLFIEFLVWKLVKQAKIVGHDTETVIQRLSEATWIKLEGSDPSLLEPKRLDGLKNQVYRKLCKEFGCAENLLLHLSLNDKAVHDCTVAIILCQLKIQKKPSMATEFVSWLKRVSTGCCR